MLKVPTTFEQGTSCNHFHCTTRANDITNNQTSRSTTNRCENPLALRQGRDSLNDVTPSLESTTPVGDICGDLET